MLRSAVLILSGNLATSVLLFLRTLLVARLISVADYGIAATFAMVMAVVEMMSAIGLQQQIVQSKDGDDPHFQAALQGFQFLRGMVSALLLLLLAGWVAAFLRVPEAAWGYRALALVPLLTGLQHFDVIRFGRALRFWPGALAGVSLAVAALVLVLPLTVWFDDWRVMLFSIIGQTAVFVVATHLLAERPYRLVFDRKVMGRSFRFGWPLLINNMLLFAVFNGDRLIVGREMGMEQLAIYAMGLTLTLTPAMLLVKSAQSLLLPQLAAMPRDTVEGVAQFGVLAMAALQAGLAMGTFLILAIALFGDPVVEFLLGPRYEALKALLPWLAIMQAIWVFKTGPSVIALAAGRTENDMIANLVRVAALPLTWIVALHSGNIMAIVAIAILAEALSVTVAILRLRRRLNLALEASVWPAALTLLLLAFAGAMPLLEARVGLGGWTSALILAGLAMACLLSMNELRKLWWSNIQGWE